MKLEVCTETMTLTLSNLNSTNAQNSQRSKQRNENEKRFNNAHNYTKYRIRIKRLAVGV